jgi:hypothetical protein
MLAQALANVEAIARRRREQTHCKHGHPLSGANLYLRPDRPGRRECKTCRRAARARAAPATRPYEVQKRWREQHREQWLATQRAYRRRRRRREREAEDAALIARARALSLAYAQATGELADLVAQQQRDDLYGYRTGWGVLSLYAFDKQGRMYIERLVAT